jgi:hypothetical protein
VRRKQRKKERKKEERREGGKEGERVRRKEREKKKEKNERKKEKKSKQAALLALLNTEQEECIDGNHCLPHSKTNKEVGSMNRGPNVMAEHQSCCKQDQCLHFKLS